MLNAECPTSAFGSELDVQSVQILSKGLRQVGPFQREVDERLQEPELVARVMPGSHDLAGVERTRLEQLPQAVGQLDLTRALVARR